ncbi:MAG: sulfatase-like hydrolase/transferase [Acidobacteria bacterium]|nr:sulfatase-like hydrolase/transferase [Acidobacteriota bacterium]
MIHITSIAVGVVLLTQLVFVGEVSTEARKRQAVPPNILFIILDDVGKDQLASFNSASLLTPRTPDIDAIAAAGVKFTNLYTMPECSPSRACFFTGRYPLRTGVDEAILFNDLPAAQISPFEVTTPRVLATAGYASAMVGKYHLGGPENNPDGNRTPIVLGWDYFEGNMRGGPPFIDTTLGGQYTADKEKYSCGFPVGTQKGACWFQDSNNPARCDDIRGAGYTGQQCVSLGGIPALDLQGNFASSCKDASSKAPDFTTLNGYYVWPKVIADSGKLETLTSRKYMTIDQTDAAVEWVQKQTAGGRPWMCTVSYNSDHTPYQLPPEDLYAPRPPFLTPGDCSGTEAQRIVSDLMIEAMDKEIGRLLVGIGLANRGMAGELVYKPEATNTMVIVVGDNGSYLTSVKLPYDPLRAKGTPYETGVLTPLIVAGPLVANPGRSVHHMVNAVDLFAVFGEIAGVDVRAVVPRSHILDSQPMLAYLTNPNQASIRQYNFTQLGNGAKAASIKLWPCVVQAGPASVCTDILIDKEGICEELGGTWFGPTEGRPDPPNPTCCALRETGQFRNLAIIPTRVWAIRDSRYKLVMLERAECDSGLGSYEFYDLTPRPVVNALGLDLAPFDLLTNGQPVGLTGEQMAGLQELKAELNRLLSSEAACPGDGNLDKRVDSGDLFGVERYRGQPSVFDFNRDGTTDDLDRQVVLDHFGTDCRPLR